MLLAVAACGGTGGGGDGSAGGGTATGTSTGAAVASGTISDSGFGFDTGIGGSGGVIGEIDAFGSIILNGLEMQTGQATFFIEGSDGFAQSDLREGQYVVIAGDLNALDADAVYYRSNLQGPVSAAPVVEDADTGTYRLTVLGQTVLTNPETRFDGLLAEEIGEGDLLEVSGPIDGDGRVLATYVAARPALTTYKAIGRVAQLDTGTRSFDLAGLRVGYAGATFLRFAESALSDGRFVEVRMAAGEFTAPASATAFEVERLPVPQIGEGAQLEVKGFIDSFTSPAEFTVGGVPVVTSAGTSFVTGSAAQLGLNVEVEVSGTANGDGVLVADSIEFQRARVIRIEGPVTGVDVTAGTASILGATLQIRGTTRLVERNTGVDPITLDDLMIGDVVRARGAMEGTAPVAIEIVRSVSNPGSSPTTLRGPLTGYDKSAATVEVLGVRVVDGIGSTQYQDAQGDAVGRDTFYDTLLPKAVQLKVVWADFGSLADPAERLTITE
jgi:hypothetical protein